MKTPNFSSQLASVNLTNSFLQEHDFDVEGLYKSKSNLSSERKSSVFNASMA